jgi:hypothetical protein
MRSFLFFCALPMVRTKVNPDRFAHLALFVIGIRVSNHIKLFHIFEQILFNSIHPH